MSSIGPSTGQSRPGSPSADDVRETLVASVLVGESQVIRRLRALTAKVAATPLPVLIQGETGVGKELVAQALHVASGRPGRFVGFNVCALGEALFEDALFGHVRGAFTGATGDSHGYLVEADRGTAFFDEIGGLSLAAQAKLLRALETRTFRPVGAGRDRSSDFRIVAATNEGLQSRCASRAFRADLMHRLSGVVIEVPPLGERMEDVPCLAQHFAALLSGRDGMSVTIDADGMDALMEFDWPGNVRELRLTIERAAALAPTSCLRRTDVLAAMRTGGRAANAVLTPLPDRAAFLERRLLEVLEAVQWNVDAAAAQLGLHRATVYRRLARLDRCVDGVASRRGSSRDNVRSSRDEPRRDAALPA